MTQNPRRTAAQVAAQVATELLAAADLSANQVQQVNTVLDNRLENLNLTDIQYLSLIHI